MIKAIGMGFVRLLQRELRECSVDVRRMDYYDRRGYTTIWYAKRKVIQREKARTVNTIDSA